MTLSRTYAIFAWAQLKKTRARSLHVRFMRHRFFHVVTPRTCESCDIAKGDTPTAQANRGDGRGTSQNGRNYHGLSPCKLRNVIQPEKAKPLILIYISIKVVVVVVVLSHYHFALATIATVEMTVHPAWCSTPLYASPNEKKWDKCTRGVRTPIFRHSESVSIRNHWCKYTYR